MPTRSRKHCESMRNTECSIAIRAQRGIRWAPHRWASIEEPTDTDRRSQCNEPQVSLASPDLTVWDTRVEMAEIASQCERIGDGEGHDANGRAGETWPFGATRLGTGAQANDQVPESRLIPLLSTSEHAVMCCVALSPHLVLSHTLSELSSVRPSDRQASQWDDTPLFSQDDSDMAISKRVWRMTLQRTNEDGVEISQDSQGTAHAGFTGGWSWTSWKSRRRGGHPQKVRDI
ncbi:hypothetical protein BDP81DRAFT_451305 [Colletotrichum phormii]|uniref:Uncharacterized protein n=1 Tax=Colletotrichum phormii TaxID=359342 RepID=A0AAI9ZMQ7_9PEZI|nr:uncharacterized protein BDP81DRAFT_451305 [Colletotrichum phormii]KAK1634804.1 hypothetical protein BDP81DRAFT_451305 [Colletotrichum phormii]